MNNLNSNYIHSLLSEAQLADIKQTFNDMFSVNAGRGLMNWFVNISHVIFKKKNPSITSAIFCFLSDIHNMHRIHGNSFVVLYLNVCHVSLMQAVGGYVVKDSTLIAKASVSRSLAGLPSIIPSVHSELIRKGNINLIRIWLSMFSLYRVLSFDSAVSLKTIVEPGINIRESHIQEWDHVVMFWLRSLGWTKEKFCNLLHNPSPFLIPNSSPVAKTVPINVGPLVDSSDKLIAASEANFPKQEAAMLSTSIPSIFFGAYRLVSHPTLWYPFCHFHDSLFPSSKLVTWMKNISNVCSSLPLLFPFNSGALGRLGLKVEAAGKISVFAMVDCWTQWLMNPLHQAIFTLLQSIPSDGTFDQLAPINRLVNLGNGSFWSYDLSAATDRLPVLLQARILDQLLGPGLGEAWRWLMVGSSYYLPNNAYEHYKFDKSYGSSVLYAVGQPMGALSSWAMLALSHHIMVALAAYSAGYAIGNFWDYAVLGDDIVIANGKVAREYLLLCSQIGINVGIHNSLISRKGVLEFANRLVVRGEDASPVSLMELGSATRSVTACMELAKNYSLTFPQLAAVMGAGYSVLGRLTRFVSDISPRYRHMGLLYWSPWGVKPLEVIQWLNISYLVNPSWINEIPEGFGKIMSQRCAALHDRVENLRGPLKGFSGTYYDFPCVTVYNKMNSWFEEVGIAITSRLYGEVYSVISEIVNPILLHFRKDLANASEEASSVSFGHEPKPATVLLWNSISHNLSLTSSLHSPNVMVDTHVVSAAHIWTLWKNIPKWPNSR